MQIQIGSKSVWLNYHHLYYFNVIASEGSIATASRKLRIGQPTLSSQLKQFEESIGLALFDRKHKKLFLNETGKIIQQYANEIFRIGTEMIEVVHDKMPSARTHVQIGALDSIPKHTILEISRAAFAMGNCTISILEGKIDELMRELSNHKIDLIVSNFAPSSNEFSGIRSRRIARSPVIICGSKEFTPLKKNFPKSLGDQPFIMPTHDSKLRHDIDHYFQLSGVKPDVVAETQDTAIQKLMGIDGMGLIPIQLSAAKDYLQKKTLFEIGRLENISEDLFLISATRKIANPISSALMKSFEIKIA